MGRKTNLDQKQKVSIKIKQETQDFKDKDKKGNLSIPVM